MPFHTAVSVRLVPPAVITSPGRYVRVPSDHPAKVDPGSVMDALGAVNVSPIVTVPDLTGTEPVPPLASNVTVYVSAVQRA